MPAIDETDFANEVFLRGRLAAAAEPKELPSGDLMLTFRLIVARPKESRVDTIECVALAPGVRRKVDRAVAGDTVEVNGQLHRRFWRGPAGPASRYSVQVSSVKIIRVGRRADVTRARKPASV